MTFEYYWWTTFISFLALTYTPWDGHTMKENLQAALLASVLTGWLLWPLYVVVWSSDKIMRKL